MAYCKTCGTTNISLFYASIKTYCKEHWKAVGADGQIEKWRTPSVEMVCECDEDAQHGWKKLPND